MVLITRMYTFSKTHEMQVLNGCSCSCLVKGPEVLSSGSGVAQVPLSLPWPSRALLAISVYLLSPWLSFAPVYTHACVVGNELLAWTLWGHSQTT